MRIKRPILSRMQRALLIPILSGAPLFNTVRATPAPPERVNIVVLYSDDAGYADIGFQANVSEDMKHLTPNIDTLARDGVRFDQAYMTADVCSPSRAALMTGRYQQRFGHDTNIPPGTRDGLPRTETFGAKRLQELGYKTGLVGKWHLGYPVKFHPTRRGFDWFYGLLQGSRPYFFGTKINPDRRLRESGGQLTRDIKKAYVTDVFGDAACRFIAAHKQEPFFLFVSFTAPHGPLQPRRSDASRIAHIAEKNRRNYAGLVVALDDNVGKILAALKDEGIEDKTLVVFTNDNGGSLKNGANNYPLRGGKGTWWEGGFRVPMALRWPGVVKPGTVVEEPVIALDLLPTFIAAAGGEVQPDWNLDGVNLIPRLTGKQDRLPPRTLYWRKASPDPYVTVVREGNWRLVFGTEGTGQPVELYDLDNDVGETTDLAATHPKIVEALMAKGLEWQKDFPGSRFRHARPAGHGEAEDDE